MPDAKAAGLYLSEGPFNSSATFGGYRLSLHDIPEFETGHIIAGGAFGLSADDVIFDYQEYVLDIEDYETEETAMRSVVPSLLYAL